MFLRCATVVACLVCLPVFTLAEDEPNGAITEQWRAIPVPERTPFDADARQREGYLHSYRDGYFWAQGNHLACPTNPAEHNLHAIRGWVEGWQAGVAAGGTGDLPAKYAAYLRWSDDAAKTSRSVDNPRHALGHVNPAVRAAAAARLNESYVAPDRKPWEDLLTSVKIGDTKQKLHALLTAEQAQCESGVGTGPNYLEEYRLDDRWMLRCWFRLSGDVLFDIQLHERLREVWVAPPDRFNGLWTTYFVNGQPAHQINYRDGAYHGEFVAFHPAGGRSYTQHYQNGEAEGWDTGYYPSGNVSYRGLYQGGKQVGVWTWYHEDGTERETSQHPEPAGEKPDASPLPMADEQAAKKPPLKPRPAQSPPTGKLVGRFVFDGDRPQALPIEGVNRDNYDKLGLRDQSLLVAPDGGIKNIIVWISDRDLPIPPHPVEKRLPAPARLAFTGGLFQPRVLAYEAWRPFLISNTEPVSTNVHWESLTTSGTFNRLLAPGQSHTFEIPPQKLPNRVESNVHPWAKAWLFPCAHPYFAVTDDNGNFEIERLPPGEWEFRAWHERWGYVEFDAAKKRLFKQHILPGSNDLGVVKVRQADDGASAAVLPGEREPSLRDWKKIRSERIENNSRQHAASFVGRWKMTLPRGFTYDIEITQQDDGLLLLQCQEDINSLGTYAFANNWLQLVETRHDNIQDFVWEDRDGWFVLVGEEHSVGAHYLGAKLERRNE